jgi:DNA-binding transcriptional ArsR family regulator/uncharacterized protein YndB with AHSA1/START domain
MSVSAPKAMADVASEEDASEAIWRALANPTRRRILDVLSRGSMSTGAVAASIPELGRFAVMQHLGVLADAGLVVVRRHGRRRSNHLDPTHLRRWYERWVEPLADMAAAEMLAPERHTDDTRGEVDMPDDGDEIRTVRIETELRFRATPERLFRALTEETLEWFPHTYGGDRVRAIVVEPRVGGAHYEDWGDGMGHLYGHVTVFDRPRTYATRGRITPGTILDTRYDLEARGDHTVLEMSKVAVGPMSAAEADSVRTFGDIARFEPALRELVEP